MQANMFDSWLGENWYKKHVQVISDCMSTDVKREIGIYIPPSSIRSQWHVTFYELTHLSLDEMAAISQTMFSNAFSWMKRFVFR